MTTETGTPAIPDLNDASVRLDRNAAMNAMRARRRETAAKEMEPDDAKEFLAQPFTTMAATDPATGEAIAGTGVALAPAQDPEDTDATDAAANAERARLEAAALKADEAKETPTLDATKQVAAQTEDLVLTDDDLSHIRIPMIVNGVTKMVTGTELRAEAQKVSAADQYLATAKEVLGAAKSAPAAPAPAAALPVVKPATSELINKAVEALFQGREEDAARLFAEAMSGGTTQDVDAIAAEVEQRTVIKSALRQFQKENAEIVADPIKRRLADEFLNRELAARGAARLEDLPVAEIPTVVETAGRVTMDWLKGAAGSTTPVATGGTATTLSERLKRKEGIDELPAAAVRSSSVVPQPKTTLDKLNEMRKARGQPVA